MNTGFLYYCTFFGAIVADSYNFVSFIKSSSSTFSRVLIVLERGKMEEGKKKQHFVLVHGLGHGGWCWYKLITLLHSRGHRVTALDLGASGFRPEKLYSDEVCNFFDYSQPLITLMESLPTNQRVILIGHSYGGMSISLAMEKFPGKILAAVFLTAIMPDCSSLPSYPLEQFVVRRPPETFLDSKFEFNQGPEKVSSTLLLGPICLSTNLYQNCSLEDVTLAKALVRTGSMFVEDLSKMPKFSRGRYGCVSRVYIVCNEDNTIPEDFQRWMIENDPPKEVKEIKGSDHMPMLSKPLELLNILLEIAQIYSEN